jgi:hypothetical protein
MAPLMAPADSRWLARNHIFHPSQLASIFRDLDEVASGIGSRLNFRGRAVPGIRQSSRVDGPWARGFSSPYAEMDILRASDG